MKIAIWNVNSMFDVATLFGLGRDEADKVAIGTRAGRRTQMARPVITAIVAELQFKLLVLRRRESARQGNVVSHEEAKRRLGRWLNSSGN